ncbi:glutamine-hydrolyzing carbamoyl-phosphate synthase small subunit [Legionella waltersii]|uniref:Carbamoyl phosphate synthase small chain n=1 Tax=Legionella waltersii TaxID=66969 RepID=A0A0W1AMM4_9GAMM|nr:glutamine-hydrolyzing carbamoyl-phosphate synthase small subunit [Legionella waltersii]KTD82619.1 carbamoyl phosphate synthase, small subunit [Legionella waltersii]SNV07913.1 carbamoyl phosphate synthase, small subunit [Legionella waltersii]
MINKSAILALADGTVYEGISVGAEGDCVGELVFNTSMTGYQEMLTDPSYARQIITLTTSHVGNTGCNSEDMESTKVWAAGMVMKNCTMVASNYRSEQSFPEWMRKRGVVAIAGVDTREITAKLRDTGAIGACISTHVDQPEDAVEKAKAFSGLSGVDLAIEVSRQAVERWHEGQGQWAKNPKPGTFHLVVYDFGVKHNILRILYDKGFHITIVPAKTSAQEVIAMNPDGILLSNGPGDPQACTYAIAATKEFLERSIPVFGICLGFQILALASGGKTVKMKFGHHGSNHPVVETTGNKRVFITSQNHGFAVDEATLPDYLEVTHRSLFDNSLQGIRHKFKPAFGFQGHPEASPGPHDIDELFDEFLKIINKEDK